MQGNFLKIFLVLFFVLHAGPKTIFCDAHLLFYAEQFSEAAELYLQCSDDPESLFYASVCFEKMGEKEKAIEIRETIATQFSSSPFAEEAIFFNLLNDPHPDLERLEESPYLAYFLISKGGKENLIEALSLLNRPRNDYFLLLKHRAFLDLATLEWEERNDPIHLEYGLAILRQSARFVTPPELEEERDYLFALFYSETSKKLALKYIDKSIKKTNNPHLFKLLKLKGQLLESIEVLNLAEALYPPEEELLDLWLLKANLYLKQHEEDSALNQLAAIINSPVASIKRVEAMVLRQEVFTRMGRSDLAARHSATLNHLIKELHYDQLSK